MKKITKEDILFHFQDNDFPYNLISSDVLVHKDILFSDYREEPELIKNTKKIKYSNSFIIDDELERKKKIKLIKPKQNENNWRITDTNNDFFDDFKGKTDEKQVKIFKINQHLQITKEYDLFANNNHVEDMKDKKGLNLLKYYEPETKTIVHTSDSIFENADDILNKEIFNFSSDPDIVEIKFLHEINKYLNYPVSDQLWYIFHPVAKSAFGPLSTNNIEEMYNSKVVNGQTEIRFIDTYIIRNKKQFTFFKLKTIERPDFIEQIEISPLFKIVSNIKNKNNDNTNKSINNMIINKEKIGKIENIDSIDTKPSLKMKNNILDSNDEDFFNNKKKDKKQFKGKPINIDVKLGFKIDEDENKILKK